MLWNANVCEHRVSISRVGSSNLSERASYPSERNEVSDYLALFWAEFHVAKRIKGSSNKNKSLQMASTASVQHASNTANQGLF